MTTLPVPIGESFTFYDDFVPTLCMFYYANKSSNTALNGFEMVRIRDGAHFDYKNGGFVLPCKKPQKQKLNDVGDNSVCGGNVSGVQTRPGEGDIARSSGDIGSVGTNRQHSGANSSGNRILTPHPPPWRIQHIKPLRSNTTRQSWQEIDYEPDADWG